MAGMSELRQRAKSLGIPAREIRSAESSAELRELIKSHGNSSASKPRKKAAVTKAVKKRGPGRPKGSKNKPKATATKVVKRGRGRPKGSTTKTTKRRATVSTSNGGRNLLAGIKWSQTDGWNPREGSVPDVIVKALRKSKGDRDKAFNLLKGKVDSLIAKKTRNGRSRSKDERINFLRYLISRNAWAFALATGQHEIATDRAEYGTAGTGEGVWKRKGSKARSASGAKKSTGRPRGRPKGSGKATGTVKRGRGRPKGSKNKPKSAAAAGRKAARKR